MKKAAAERIEFSLYRKPGIEIVCGENVVRPFTRHSHKSLCVGLIRKGTRIFRCCGKVYPVGTGQIFLLPPDTAHATEAVNMQPASYLVLIIHPEVLAKLTENQAIVFEKFVFDSPSLYQDFLNLREMLLYAGPIADKESLLLQSIGAILAQSTRVAEQPLTGSAQKAAVTKIKEYLEAYYAKNFSLTELAGLVHHSPYYLIRVFTGQTGVPPHIYQRQIRIRYAKRMLSAGSSIASAALNTGFYDQSHFARIFKHLVGVTPGEYIRQFKTGRSCCPVTSPPASDAYSMPQQQLRPEGQQ